MKQRLDSGFIRAAALVMLSSQLSGCGADSSLGIRLHPPECNITSLEKQDGAFAKFATIVMTVENTGKSSTAYNVACFIKLKTGNTILETSSAYFGTLRPGEAAIGIAPFSRIEKHREYGYAEYELYWHDAEGGYYDK
jgi:hypothetical protein